MSNQDLKLAQEWAAEYCDNLVYHKAQAAVNVIQSLGTQWVSVEELQGAINEMESFIAIEGGGEEYALADEVTKDWVDILKKLITPKLPTLADMTNEERKACKWMQAKASGSDDLYVLANVSTSSSYLWTQDGHVIFRGNDTITPIPTVPKFKWPGHDEELPKGMRLADHPDYGRVVVSPKSDSDAEYKIFYSDEDSNTGAYYQYASKRSLDFLDTNTSTK